MLMGFAPAQRPSLNRRRKSQQGYILVTLTLFVALLAVAAMAIAPRLVFQIQRDREEEMIHRGVQYSRAIQKYFKKFGRYPTSLKDLENTNNLRFLRKAYKDPITGKDFKLLHFGEVQLMSMGPGIAGATPVSAMAGNGMPGQGTPGLSSNSAQGFSLGSTGTQTPTGAAQATGQENAPADANSSTNSPADQKASSSDSAAPQIIGGPIVGVISASKAKSIREFGGKSHYNQWQFIYDPAMQLASKGLINTPAQPPLQGTVANVNGPGQPGTQSPGNPGSGAGSNQFGTSTNAFGSQPQPSQAQPQSPVSQPQP
jgi:type II secretory pathway pseudopilin PulG